ncbi:MAG: arsenic resistance protein [Azospirillum brasilense]|nr:MAG: arsenic resistance protein [Azospirillum brasilense]
MTALRDALEAHQIPIYFAAVTTAAAVGMLVPGATILEAGINPSLAVMLFATFLPVPLADIGRAVARLRFLAALLATNFVLVPTLVLGLVQFLPGDPMIRLGVLLVLLAPCIDYVVTFSHVGRADARLLLAATPALLLVQVLLLPLYLRLILGDDAARLVRFEPFLHAFVWLIAAPLALAAMVQAAAQRSGALAWVSSLLGLLPVPATAAVLFVVVAAVTPQLGLGLEGALMAVPLYVAYAVAAPLLGWAAARAAGLDGPAGRAVAFSAGTRNSLVVLPLAFAVPNAVPVLPAIIVAQTMVELVASLAYMRLIPKLQAPPRKAEARG